MNGLDGYLATLHEELSQSPTANSQQPTANNQQPTANAQQPKPKAQPLDYQQQKEQQKKLRTLRRTAETLGEQVSKLHDQQAELEKKIETSPSPQLIEQYTLVNSQLQEVTKQWEDAEFALMEYEEEIQ